MSVLIFRWNEVKDECWSFLFDQNKKNTKKKEKPQTKIIFFVSHDQFSRECDELWCNVEKLQEIKKNIEKSLFTQFIQWNISHEASFVQYYAVLRSNTL